jgi:hypothetical protein
MTTYSADIEHFQDLDISGIPDLMVVYFNAMRALGTRYHNILQELAGIENPTEVPIEQQIAHLDSEYNQAVNEMKNIFKSKFIPITEKVNEALTKELGISGEEVGLLMQILAELRFFDREV